MKEESVYQEILKKEEIKLGHAYKGVERANEMKDKFAEKDEKMNELSYNRRAKHPIVEFQQQARDFHIISSKISNFSFFSSTNLLNLCKI